MDWQALQGCDRLHWRQVNPDPIHKDYRKGGGEELYFDLAELALVAGPLCNGLVLSDGTGGPGGTCGT